MVKEKIILYRDSVELYGLLEGPDIAEGMKQPLVLIMHGFNTNSRQHPFYYLVRELWEKGMTTLRFDFEGHGRSGGSMLDITLDALLEDAELFYQYAGKLDYVSEIFLIGYSMGGVIASRLAVMHKEEVRKLVMLSPAANIQDRVKSGNFLGTFYDPDDPPEYLDTEDFRIGRAYILNARNFQLFEPLAEYNGNALIIYGDADEQIPLEYTLRYKSYIRNLTLVSVPGEGHMWTEKGDEAVRLISQFLSD